MSKFQEFGGKLLHFPRKILKAATATLSWGIMRLLDSATFRLNPKTNKIELSQSVAGRYLPIAGPDGSWHLGKTAGSEAIAPGDGLPIPPQRLWAEYGSTADEYLKSGQEHFDRMKMVLMESGFQFSSGQRILDFGCAAGRMTRCLAAYDSLGEIWGVDQSAPHIQWCQQNFDPPFRFITATTSPHLAFEDNYFDLIFAGSVFTHIGDLEDSWLMELRRITKPGGYLYLTAADSHTMDILRNSPPGHWLHESQIRQQLIEFEAENQVEADEYQLIVIDRVPGNSQVFHSTSYIREYWDRYLEILSITPEAYGYQTAITLRKRPN